MTSNLILAIIAFVCAGIPVLGIPISLIFGIIAFITAFKKRDEQSKIAIISIVISIATFIVLIVTNISFLIYEIKEGVFSSDDKYDVDYKMNIEDYPCYEKGEDVVIDEDYYLKVVDVYNDDTEYYVSLEIEGLNDYAYYSMYDFAIFDPFNEELYYPTYLDVQDNFSFGGLDEGQKETSLIKYDEKVVLGEELYLVYVDDENGVKIKL